MILSSCLDDPASVSTAYETVICHTSDFIIIIIIIIIMVLRMKFFNLLRAENIHSEVADVTGTVRYRRSNLCTSPNNVLEIGVLFITFQTVLTFVMCLTSGTAALMTSLSIFNWWSNLVQSISVL